MARFSQKWLEFVARLNFGSNIKIMALFLARLTLKSMYEQMIMAHKKAQR